MDDLMIAKSILSILTTSTIDHELVEPYYGIDLSMQEKVAFLNIILIAHKKRYQSCFSEDQMSREVECLRSDYKNIFCKSKSVFISDLLVVAIFLFITSNNLRSVSFREICVSLDNELQTCNCDEIKYAMYKKLIHCIIYGALYGEEPFDSLLKQAIVYFDGCENVVMPENLMFLE